MQKHKQRERYASMMQSNFFRPSLMYLFRAEVSERNCKQEKHHRARQTGNGRAISLAHLQNDKNHGEPRETQRYQQECCVVESPRARNQVTDVERDSR